jgi:predicted alpha/beta hydrolase family esterase
MSSYANLNDDTPVVLTVPGLGGSGPSHWQTLWEEARLDTKRVELGMWHAPHRNAWVTKLDQQIRQSRAPVILAAHSLGCLQWRGGLS